MYSQQFILRFFVSIKSLKYSKGTGFWIFNNSLISNNDFAEEINFFVHNAKLFLEQNISFSNQSGNFSNMKHVRNVSFSKV